MRLGIEIKCIICIMPTGELEQYKKLTEMMIKYLMHFVALQKFYFKKQVESENQKSIYFEELLISSYCCLRT